MSGEKAANPCNKFQANIFNKSKCQNCFKSRELHLLNDHDMEQAKPIYGGWLCLAPEGTDFDNPMQKSRKWQRRFFILYEHGSLSFALDELILLQPSTLPQGTVSMSLCTDITDAEPRTGQRNALCIVTPEQEIFIRGDNKEIINGWSEQLAVYLRTNKQNQKKKRKVEPVATQEPSPAKMAATDSVFPTLESSAMSSRWQEAQLGRRPDVTPIWTVADPSSQEKTPAVSAVQCLDSGALNIGSSFCSPILNSAIDGCTDPGGNNQLAESNNTHTANCKNRDQRRSNDTTTERILGVEASPKQQEGEKAVSRKGRSEARTNNREKLQSCGDTSQLSISHPQRRAKSLDGRTSDNVMTPDLLNFKKGWMVKLDGNDQWKKYWFVLSTDRLRYYKDSAAEEASDVDGEIDLSKCYNVSEYHVQRNYGFQIHTPKAVYTLSAMTAGIRRNWVQALMKNVHPANAPDVASLPCTPREALPKPDVTRDSPTDKDFHLKPRSATERRHESHYKTLDWNEFRPQDKLILETEPISTKPPRSPEMGDLERRRRREERRRRYENMLGFPLGWEEIKETPVDGRALSLTAQQQVEEEMEACWKQVERTVFRLERTVPLYSETKDIVEMEKLLDGYRKYVEDVKAKLEESEQRRLELEAQLSTAGCQQQQLDQPLFIEADFCHMQSLKDVYKDTKKLLQQQNILEEDASSPLLATQTPSIRLHDAEGNLQELGDLLPDSVTTHLLSPLSDNQDLVSSSDGEAVVLNLQDVAASAHQNQLNREDREQFLTSGTQLNTSGYDLSSLALENSADGDDDSLKLNSYIEQHIPLDQAMLRRLSHEVELLAGQNEALNQRNQEMLNQLTEADREIERLKAELSSRNAEPHHLLPVEQQGKRRVEDLEKELSLRSRELVEARTLITSLEENLREAEALLQLNVPDETEEPGEVKSDSAATAEECLLRCFKAKLTELERQLNQSQMTCRELRAQRAPEVDADIRRLNQGLDEEKIKGRREFVSGEESVQQVMEGMVMRLEVLRKLLEAIDRLDFGKESEPKDEEPTVVSQVRWEEGFWSSLLRELVASPSQSHDEKPALLSEVTEQMMFEKQVLLLGYSLLSGSDEGDKSEAPNNLDIIWNNASVTATEIRQTEKSSIFDFDKQVCDVGHFRAMTQMKITLLNHITSSVRSSAPEKLQFMLNRLYNFHISVRPWFGVFHSAATEALYCCRLSRLQSKYERECVETSCKLLSSSPDCSNCVKLMEENKELNARLQQGSSWCDKRDTCCQTDETYAQDTDTELQKANESAAGEIGEENTCETPETEDCMEILLSDAEGHLKIQELSAEKTDETHKETVPCEEMDHGLVLRRRAEELEELLSAVTEKMKGDFDGQMVSVQMQHQKEIEKLKAACEHGFASIQESHLKVTEGLQRRHQQEVERLLMERERLLEEESAATATAIEAIKNAHCRELERELQRMQKRCRSENSSGNAQLQDVYRQHSEELASYQRELQVLSEQFSLKCLENGHLVQALDAERKALCQCQQENQDMRTRNQELSGHLAAEITRLCSLAEHDDLLLSQGMDVYEMEITLRVKESEVQCLKQAIESLKDELHSAQRDKRNATKKYKEVYTELSIVRAQAERKIDELRENLKLAHQALGQTSR